MSEYIEFIEVGDTGKTKVFDVRTLGGSSLGVVKWYGAWRRYVLFAGTGTVWSPGCMETVITFINGLMDERSVAAYKKACTGGLHVYMTKEDKSAMKCERCGKPYSEYDAL